MIDRNIWIKGTRLLISAFIFYEMFIKEAFGDCPFLLYGTVILATVCVGGDILANGGKLPVLGFPFVLFVYGVYSFITGSIISKDISWFNSIMVTYFAFSIVCFDCCYVIKKNESSEWLLNIFLITACACAVKTIFYGAEFRTEVVVRTMSENNNPNILGFTMIIGIFSLISRKKYVITRFWLTMAVALIFLYVILLTASRKCLFSALVMLFIWIFSALRTDRGFSLSKISMIFGIITTIGIGAYYIVTRYYTTSSYARVLLLLSGVPSKRTAMYREAIEYWETSPIIGIGFGQFQIWSPFKAYSHSSYAEILCCTGIIGTLLFFLPLMYYFYNIVNTMIGKDVENRYDFTICVTMAIIELILGLGQIYIYDVSHLLILTYLSIAVESISNENKRDQKLQEIYGETIIQRRFFRPKRIGP